MEELCACVVHEADEGQRLNDDDKGDDEARLERRGEEAFVRDEGQAPERAHEEETPEDGEAEQGD